jgi:hypothetical protein
MGTETPIAITRSGGAITVRTADWEIMHDLAACGSIASIRLANRVGENLLAEPFRAYVDGHNSLHSPARRASARRLRDGTVKIRTSGVLRPADGVAPGLSITQEFLHTREYIRATVTLTARTPVRCAVVGICGVKLSDRLTDFVAGPSPSTNRKPQYGELFGPMEDQTWGTVRFDGTPVFTEPWVPFDLAVFRPGHEGIQVRPASAWYGWNEGLGARPGRGRYCIVGLGQPRAIEIVMEPYHAPDEPIALAGTYRFSYYLGIPRASARTRTYRTLAIDSHPFPSDEDIRQWAHRGVELLRLHDEYDFGGATDTWWRNWTYPPYDTSGMRELARVIATAHRYDMKVIPYLSVYECYPTSPAFRRVRRWRRLMKPGGHEQFTGPGGVAVFGALLCPDSGWTRYAARYLRKLRSRHDFDGFYFDWTTNIPCFNRLHARGIHSGIDGIYALFREARRIAGPEGIIESHVQGQAMDIIAVNCSDQIVTLEERQRHDVYAVDDMPRSIRFMGSGAVAIVPNILYPRDGDRDPRHRLREGLSRFVVMGTVPYSYRRWEDRWGYTTAEEARGDPDGLYAMFDALKTFDLSTFRFRDCYESPVTATVDGVRTALYTDDDRAIVVVSNTGPERTPRFSWKLLDWPKSWHAEMVLSVAAVGAAAGQDPPVLACCADLGAEKISLSLGPFEYRLYYIRPHREEEAYIVLDSWPWEDRMVDGGLTVRGNGPPERSGRAWFKSPHRPTSVQLDGRALEQGTDWTWEEGASLGSVRYVCRGSASVLRMGF